MYKIINKHLGGTLGQILTIEILKAVTSGSSLSVDEYTIVFHKKLVIKNLKGHKYQDQIFIYNHYLFCNRYG